MKQPIEQDIIKAYNVAKETGADSTCKVLEALYPSIDFSAKDNRPVEERIKTFDDACRELGENHLYVQMFKDIFEKSTKAGANINSDVVAFLKLRIICAALNEGWEPQFTENEWRWYPWFFLYTEEELSKKSEAWKTYHALKMLRPQHPSGYDGLAFAFSNAAPSSTYTYVGSRLCLKSEALAKYCGTQFIDVWADFILIYR